ncbi:MAG TPA: hypothetical protein VMJ10_15340 [Kofleriaceae bacterium]|nr:hypothetical protein [Kofleriaceae bacterium]
MRETRISLLELGLISATRGLLGLGLGILLARHVARDRHVLVGCTLATVGALSTIPFAVRLIKRRHTDSAARAAVAS